ncbi:uncharacterized protein YbjT (DUF2867 family) [Kribbella amoyensis]|uniref:Uncharacterized protein YbjT (DUF2867 family) n=1 Tax=Kribbella amoyensis TaxID=996641 RepID=A0A561AZI4_9ACTN|nr:SDR family oxidoreductase [Kribbella amoyensis]TWD72023.1 uncharacterized protein YbjT (DUF2867 family) [Kribbella amoyensis]
MRIVVIGGTGLIGSKVVEKLTEHGHEAVVAVPKTGVNTLTGAGLAEVMKGTDVVVDVSNSPSFEADAVMEFFRTSTTNVLAAEAEAGVGHHVALSVVGTERLPDSGYFRAKIAQEELIEKSAIPYSLVHATQFYEFVQAIADAADDGGTVRIAPVAFRPMAAEDVAKAVGRTAVGTPLNGRIDIAGPQEYQMDEFFRRALKAHSDPRDVVTDPHAKYFGAELAERTLVPAGDATFGDLTYGDWAGLTPAGK